ncbi:MAG: V-type ATP synthase subunit F [Geobacteraceae bacterium]|nr:V-type ATP synthase subunit F [Geobacteraceae bacterium]
MKSIVFITPRDASYGFSISGVSQLAITPEEAEATLRKVMAEPDSGVVVIDERLIGGIGEERFREMEKKWYGMLLVLPAPERIGEEGEDYAVRLIRRAIGYHVRLNL